jgi:hypothetical protein
MLQCSTRSLSSTDLPIAPPALELECGEPLPLDNRPQARGGTPSIGGNGELGERKKTLVKVLKLCHPTQTYEAMAASRQAQRLIQELKPNLWRWRPGTEVTIVPFRDWINRTLKPETLQRGRLKTVFMARADMVREWSILHKGRIGVLRKDSLLLLPADSAEPLW